MAGKLAHRLLWTWDHSMDWAPRPRSIQEFGCFDPYHKRPESFAEDYGRLAAYLGPKRFTGVVVYGFLRDAHGGIDGAKEVCRRARQAGMSVYPGVGINAYGGIYWEGNHEFNLSHWLDRHPDLEGVGPRPPTLYHRIACPSKKENLDWHRAAIRWLCGTFDIGGINFETGDYGVCRCDACRKRSDRAGQYAFADMAELLPPLMEEAEKARPGVVPVCECYFDNLHETAAVAPLGALPKNAVLQFCINHAYLPRFLNEITAKTVAALPPRRKVLRTHIGSQWNDERHALVARDWAAISRRVADVGMDGVTVFAEAGPARTVHEINYLALAAFQEEPHLEWNAFVARDLAPILGGESLARQYLAILEKPVPDCADQVAVRSVLKKVDDPAWQRWVWLASWIGARAR